jgi:hypothetical protein
VALLAEQIPEDRRRGLEAIVGEVDLFGALDQEILGRSLLRNAGKIAFDIGGEDRHPGLRKTFGHDLQGDGLAGAGGPGHQAMTVGHGQEQILALLGLAEKNRVVGHCR